MKELEEAILSKRFVLETSQHIPEVVKKLEGEIAILQQTWVLLDAYPKKRK